MENRTDITIDNLKTKSYLAIMGLNGFDHDFFAMSNISGQVII